ncbi:hypothetical protein LCGC14_0960420 [marine sediment metagenome]|uniref:Uncharacterized protein n=1 Tax=marine sediment metagenome TaxID=412755 RepID=A0A0F9RL57_9ZZZZ
MKAKYPTWKYVYRNGRYHVETESGERICTVTNAKDHTLEHARLLSDAPAMRKSLEKIAELLPHGGYAIPCSKLNIPITEELFNILVKYRKEPDE